MSHPNDQQRIADMLESIDLIDSYTRSGIEALRADRQAQDAVLRRLQIIGEAASKLSDEQRARLPVPWERVIGLRHVLVHDYNTIDLDRIWSIIEHRLPELRTQLQESDL